MYDIFRKNLGLMIAPANENSTGQDPPVNQRCHFPRVQTLTFRKKVGVNDELVGVVIVNEKERHATEEGRKVGRNHDQSN